MSHFVFTKKNYTHISLVGAIADLLNISNDSVYRLILMELFLHLNLSDE